MCNLVLPKLNLHSRQDLGAILRKLELDPADPQLLQGVLASGEPLHLGVLVHETSIQISEIPLGSDYRSPAWNQILGETLYLRLDQPFYFLVVEPKSWLILLMGQLVDPTTGA
jgi:serine protease inhibitor